MKNLKRTISIFSIVSVITLVLFSIICPQIGGNVHAAHSSCDNKKSQLSEANSWDCLGSHINSSEYLTSTLPETLSLFGLLAAVSVVFAIIKIQPVRRIWLSEVIRSRWRTFENRYLANIKPKTAEPMFSWLHVVGDQKDRC